MSIKKPILLFVLTFLLTCMQQLAKADEIRLKNGDVITGQIVKKETATLLFKTSYAGEINVQWSEIESLKSEKPVRVVLSDGSIIKGPLRDAEPGAAKILLPVKDKTPAGKDQENKEHVEKDFDLTDTRYINPTPDLTGEGMRWTGNINAGGSLTSGNTDTRALRFDAESIVRTLNNRYTVGGVFNRVEDSGRNTQFNSRGYGKYDRFFSRQWYGYLNASMENDRFRDLRLRTVTGAGSGYQIFETPNLNLALEGGLNYIQENYYADEDDHYPGARWAIKYDQLVYKGKIKVFHEHEALVGFQDTNHLLFYSKTGLRFPLVFNMNASTQFNYNWDSSPSPGRAKTDSALLFTVGYGW